MGANLSLSFPEPLQQKSLLEWSCVREKAAKASSFLGSELAEIVVYLLWELFLPIRAIHSLHWEILTAGRPYYSGRSHSEGFWLDDRADEHWMKLQWVIVDREEEQNWALGPSYIKRRWGGTMERDGKGAAENIWKAGEKPSKLNISGKHFPDRWEWPKVTQLAAD